MAACNTSHYLRYVCSVGAIALLFGSAGASAQRASQDHANSQGWRGIVKAIHQPSLSSELSTSIAAIGFREGQRFKQGETLLEFDCRRHRQDLAALAASVREARVIVNTNAYLEKRGASNSNDVEVARARHDKAIAEHAALQQRLTGCTISAPFNGVVLELGVAVHETPASGKPLMTIASADAIEVEMIVDTRSLAMLRVGTLLAFHIDHTEQPHAITVTRIGGAIDAVSQTAKVYASFSGDPTIVLPGSSGTAINARPR